DALKAFLLLLMSPISLANVADISSSDEYNTCERIRSCCLLKAFRKHSMSMSLISQIYYRISSLVLIIFEALHLIETQCRRKIDVVICETTN
ncbi:10950_t:CDS:2, partial [Paraglomus occultum]